MPLAPHFFFCVIATLVFGAQFIRKRSKHYIYLVIAVDLTLITQFFSQDYVIIAAFAAEIILLVMAIVSARNTKKEILRQEEEKKKSIALQRGKNDAEKLARAGADDYIFGDENDDFDDDF